MHHKNQVSLLIIIFLITFLGGEMQAQCRNYARKKCLPELVPFIHNGQMNSTSLGSGDMAQLLLTFYSGQDYRLLVCGDKKLNDLYFEVKDTDNTPIYSSKGKDINHWDFNVGATQQLQIDVIVPDSSSPQTSLFGCAAVIIGFRE